MTEMVHTKAAPVTPAFPATDRASHRTPDRDVLRLYDALYENGGFTAHLRAGTPVITEDGFTVATSADRVQLPADTTFAMFGYALEMLLTRHPRLRAIRAREHEGHIDLEPVELHDSRDTAENTGRMLESIAGRDPHLPHPDAPAHGEHPAGQSH